MGAAFAIADHAGGKTGAQARAAAAALIGDDADEPSLGARLLAALRGVFAGSDVLPTATILERINDDDELPFGGWRNGNGLDGRGLARLLRPYGVRPRSVRVGDATPKGYRREQFEEPWARYLPPTPQKAPPATHPPQRPPGVEPPVADVADVAANPRREASTPGAVRAATGARHE